MMPRFLVSPEHIQGRRFTLQGSEAHHAAGVLRKKIGDVIDLFDGRDACFRGRIDGIDAGEVRGTLLESRAGSALPAAVTLFQALIKGPRWDWLLQKACEIGVQGIVPLVTARTVVRIGKEAVAGKLERWNRIAAEASKQCGRPALMKVEAPRLFRDALAGGAPDRLSLIPWEKEDRLGIRQACAAFEGGHAASVYVGPEGGWDGDEIASARKARVLPVRLGPTLLRSETAGLVASTL